MRCYKVGGCVRDELLGLPVKDIDWVVTGTTAAEMIARGFIQVGRDFPVFLHPESKQEYALARTERKHSAGHTGFIVHADPSVCLEDDLKRRDLTINAIAQDEHGKLIDPFNGRSDLEKGILRHVSPAFVEDPLRVLRVARFAARFGFTVANETMDLMLEIASSGELETLPVERVWQEWSRALAAAKPRLFFEVLAACGALTKVLLPQLAAKNALAALDSIASKSNSPITRCAAHLAATTGSNATIRELATRYRLPKNYSQTALLTADCQQLLVDTWNAKTIFALLTRCDAFRRPERFQNLRPALAAHASLLPPEQRRQQEDRLGTLVLAHETANSITIKDLPPHLHGSEIGLALETRRTQAIYEILSDR